MIFTVFICLSIVFISLVLLAVLLKTKDVDNVEKYDNEVFEPLSNPKQVVWDAHGKPRVSNGIIRKRMLKDWLFEPYENSVSRDGMSIHAQAEHSSFGWDYVETGDTMIVSAKDHNNCGAVYVIEKSTNNIIQLIEVDIVGAQFGYNLMLMDDILYVSAPMGSADESSGRPGIVYSFSHDGQSWVENDIHDCGDNSVYCGIGMHDGKIAFYNKLNDNYELRTTRV